MMKASPSIGLMVTLMMFPQVVETIYSPALPHIAQGFGVATSTAAQTLSIYFIAFAIGVFFWGLLSDYIGRRRAMISGLVVYSLSVLCATMTESFDVLMTLRALSAFGAAVGSVVSQTMIRDAFTGSALGKVFAYMGIGISISPVVGMISGGILADHGGYPYVFTALSVLGFFLAGISLTTLAETMPDNYQKPKVLSTAKKLLTDACIWKNSLLVAGFNVALFSYYLHGPFIFQLLGYGSTTFGQSGTILALGTFLGSLVNKVLLNRQYSQNALLKIASMMLLTGAAGVFALSSSLWFLLPMVLVVMGFGIGIPNVLSQALKNYQAQAGSAGAWFGLLYYLLIGAGLSLSAMTQNLGIVLLITSAMMTLLSFSQTLSHQHLKNDI